MMTSFSFDPERIGVAFKSFPRAKTAKLFLLLFRLYRLRWFPPVVLRHRRLESLTQNHLHRIPSFADNFFTGAFSAAHRRLAFGPFHPTSGALLQFIHRHETPVMRRPLILRIGIPKSDNEPHRPFSSRPPFERRALFFLFALFAFVAFLRFGLTFRFGAFFAFHFLLALLDNFGLGRRCRFRCHDLRRLLFFH